MYESFMRKFEALQHHNIIIIFYSITLRKRYSRYADIYYDEINIFLSSE